MKNLTLETATVIAPSPNATKHTSPKVEYIMVGPEEAGRMLLRNIDNRPIVETHVMQIVEAMKAGHWKSNGATIVFSKNRLVDGQHRLNAVVRSGCRVPMLIIWNIANDVFDTIDIGRKRTASDSLAMGGENEAKRLASTLAFVGRYTTGAMRNRGYSLTPVQIEDLLVEHHAVRDSVKFVMGVGSMPLSFSVAAGIHYLYARINREVADDLIKKLASGAGLEAGHPILLLRERLFANKSDKSKLGGSYIAALTIKAFNAAIKGEKPEFLRFRSTGERPEAYPEIGG
jgi:hypothetical protein